MAIHRLVSAHVLLLGIWQAKRVRKCARARAERENGPKGARAADHAHRLPVEVVENLQAGAKKEKERLRPTKAVEVRHEVK